MQVAETKTSAAANKTIQKKRQPFFNKEGQGSFFSKSNQHTDSFFSPTAIQAKLTIGQPKDKYEVEADAMADKVVQWLSQPEVQKSATNENLVQAKTFAASVTPLVQTKCATCEMEGEHSKEEDLLQESPLELQRKPIFESIAELSEDEGIVQQKCAECEKENKKKLQTKPARTGLTSTNLSLENNLTSSKGGGAPLPDNTRLQMENSFGTDFSKVRVHTNSSAVQMNKELRAQAFTHGHDIYFNAEKYNPDHTEGQRLLAHELTHTFQQKQSNKIMRQNHGEESNLSLIENVDQSEQISSEPFDPYAQSVQEFTNQALINALLDNDAWMLEHGSTDPEHDAHGTWKERLESERVRRVSIGHVWLDTYRNAESVAIFQLITAPNGSIDVVEVDNLELIHGLPQNFSNSPLMTRDQFYSAVSQSNLTTITFEDFQVGLQDSINMLMTDDHTSRTWGVSGANSYSSTRFNMMRNAFGNHNPQSRSGSIAEVFALTGQRSFYGFGARDLNSVPWEHPSRGTMMGNYPLVDSAGSTPFNMGFDSVKMRMGGTSPSAITRLGVYLQGYAEILDMANKNNFSHFEKNAGSGRSSADIRSNLNLVVSADDAQVLRDLLSNPTSHDLTQSGGVSDTPNYQRAALRRIYDGILRDTTVQPADGGQSLSTIAQLDTALADGRIDATEHHGILTRVAEAAAGQIVSNADFDMQTHLRYEAAFRDIHPDLRPQSPGNGPVLHTSTRARTGRAASSQSRYDNFNNYLNRMASTIPEGTGALHVDIDDVGPLREFLRQPLAKDLTRTGRTAQNENFRRPQVRAVYNSVLANSPVQASNGTQFDSVDDIHAAYEANTIDPREYSRLMHRVGRMAANQVEGRTLDVVQSHNQAVQQHNQRLTQYRQNLDLTRAEIRSRNSPEYMASIDAGGGVRGRLRASGSYGLRGGGISALIGLGQELYSISTDGRETPDAYQRLFVTTGREGLRGGLSSAGETYFMARASESSLRQGATMSANRVLAQRIGARFIPGGVVDAGIEVGSMAFDNRENRSDEVAYRLTRAFIIGGSSALAASYAGGAVGSAVGSVFPGIGTGIGFVVGLGVGMLVGAIANSLFPSYDELVSEAVILEEFKNNINAQAPTSLNNQVLAQQEYDLFNSLVHGPTIRGPYNMYDIYDQRNTSDSPATRIFNEALINDQVHGGCQDCHTRSYAAHRDSEIPLWDLARTAPIDRMADAGFYEHRNRGIRPGFMGSHMPVTNVPEWMYNDLGRTNTGQEMAQYVNMVQSNIGAWRNVLGSNGKTIIPPGLMNRSMSETELYQYMRNQINAEQENFRQNFGDVDEADYEHFRSMIEDAQ